MKVNGKDYPIYYGKKNMFETTTNQLRMHCSWFYNLTCAGQNISFLLNYVPILHNIARYIVPMGHLTGSS